MNTKKQNKKKKGFTLIELIVVIAIIAILAAIAIPNFLSIQRKSRVKADVASSKSIYDATSALIAEGVINPQDTNINGKMLVLSPKDDKLIKNDAEAENANADNKKAKTEQDAILAIENYLNTNGKTVPTSQAYSGKSFGVTISGGETSPKIQVFVMNQDNGKGTELYPNDEVKK
ncbi:prepilin-type N-terminal cleavage/methylation domain-containing protein [Clostridium perfringens]|uniref:prepilin-type N-terminal cleavage/methylation domain-containing protein n=1 Tax=Clostridium perfringens TaxID=1502 RepID=UPI001A1F9952|nr:prepilin-type N-terminal cleavage/methylation domain-containing protein [Clostridium perfringens]MDH5097431.1 putative major pilin subunit [Clostridium perfringens]MDK0751065.1 prepilin-type N-terminal cleavage/methylation domain-containing protein [Clostridium perfringens]MDM0783970.1 prepilin-type N-terminal cleavage/methylation domain-containing protein [Clostridium perfringens]MDM0865474.1 prepilin-type N-terminal cleavage/methylation domain-containing protein [Clostridium perfringens]M